MFSVERFTSHKIVPILIHFFLTVVQKPNLAYATSLSRFLDLTHTHTHTHTHPAGHSDQLITKAATYRTYIRKRTSMPSVGSEPTIPAIEQPQTYAFDGAATTIGCSTYLLT